MRKGILIAFEGLEGAGKTTQAQMLVDYFEKNNKPFLLLREPGGTQISEQIREVVLSVKNKKIQPITEALLFQAARAQITSERILPALNESKIVVCDRYRDSSVVYQGYARGLGQDLIETLNDISTQKTKPDLTILLDVPAKVGLERRRKAKDQNRIDKESLVFHNQVRKAYLDWAGKNKERFVVFDGEQAIPQIHQQIIDFLLKKRLY